MVELVIRGETLDWPVDSPDKHRNIHYLDEMPNVDKVPGILPMCFSHGCSHNCLAAMLMI